MNDLKKNNAKLIPLTLDKLRYFAFCVSVVLVASVPAQAEVEFPYDKNTFINYNNCLGIYPGTSLALEKKVWIFSIDQSPMISKVAHVIPAKEAQKKFDALGVSKVSQDKPLWAEIGCAFQFRGDMPELLARVNPESGGIGFAIRGLPAGAWISEGKGDSVAVDVKDNPYVEVVQHLVTDACYAPDSMVRVKRFPIRKGRAIIQLDIGNIKKLSTEKRRLKIEEKLRQAEEQYYKWAWPEQKKKTLERLEKKDYVESVEICRFFLDEKRVLKAEKISRSTGVDERVDTAPDMNTDNWADTTDSAIGFISMNEGKDWDVLLVDVGFEGINYSIQRLNDSVVHYNRSLYTYH